MVYNKEEPKSKEYYNTLFNAIENGAGWILDHLMSVDLSTFAAHGAAPETEGLAMVTEVTKPDAQKWLETQYEQGIGAFSNSIIDMIAIERDAAQFAPPNVSRYMNSKVISTFLYGEGFAPREYRLNGVHKHSWFKGDDIAFEKEKEKLRAGKPSEKGIAI